jgi:hypothetical protein
MKSYEKPVFIILCVVMWAVSGDILSKGLNLSLDVVADLGKAVVSIGLWSFVGLVAGNTILFFRNRVKPGRGEGLSLWQMGSIGLGLGVLLKVAFPSLP